MSSLAHVLVGRVVSPVLAAADTLMRLPAASADGLARVREFEAKNLERPQDAITTHHILHGGLYIRTITMPAGCELTGALIKIPTLLVFNGDALVSNGDVTEHFQGYHLIPASAGRKQAFAAHRATTLTMIFPTSAKTVEEAEAEFTDEADRLFSRHAENVINITGE